MKAVNSTLGKLGQALASYGREEASEVAGIESAELIENTYVRGTARYEMAISGGESAVQDYINETRTEFEASGGVYTRSGKISETEYGHYDWNENKIYLYADAGLDTEMEELFHWQQFKERNLIFSGKTILPGSALEEEIEEEAQQFLEDYGWELIDEK